jgi:hypothetical protein
VDTVYADHEARAGRRPKARIDEMWNDFDERGSTACVVHLSAERRSYILRAHQERAPVGTYLPDRPTKYCHACSRTIDAMAVVCTSCGVMQRDAGEFATEKRILPAGLLCFLFGVFGVHRFYVGKIGTGILQILTLGGLGIWMLVDLIMIVTGNFKDKEGNRITEWV